MVIVRNKIWIMTTVLVLVAVLGLAVAGCGSTTTTAASATTTTAATATTAAATTTSGAATTATTAAAAKVKSGTQYAITNPPKAGGWDRADWVGVQYLINDLGWEVAVAEGVPYPQSAATAAGYAEKGYNPVIFPDNGQIEAFKSVPAQYPKTWFVMMSGVDALPDAPNVAAWVPDFYKYGNVVGIIAAKASKSGKIGVIGGVPIPVLTIMFSGVIEGVKAVNPNAEVTVSWVGDWVDLPKHKEVTNVQVQKGVDVIFAVTGPGTTGVFESAESGGAKVIGYAADWYDEAPKAILTSALIDKGKMYQQMAEAFTNGTLTKQIYPCGNEYFAVAPYRNSVSGEVEKDTRETIAKLRSGELVIPVVSHDEINTQ